MAAVAWVLALASVLIPAVSELVLVSAAQFPVRWAALAELLAAQSAGWAGRSAAGRQAATSIKRICLSQNGE